MVTEEKCACGIGSFYNILKCFGNSLQSTLLLLIRLYWGALIFLHGWQVFHNIPQGIDYFKSVGIPFPEVSIYFSAFGETLSGLFIFFGFFARLFSIPLLINMICAYFFGHTEVLKSFFVNPSLFFHEDAFAFLFMSLIILIFGPGKYSLDYFLTRSYKDGKMP